MPSSRQESLEPDSKVTADREIQWEKQYRPIVDTDDGIQIDESDLQFENAKSWIQRTAESRSKMTLERVWRS
jgi:hypothetical protein